jgi:hypothetical protein
LEGGIQNTSHLPDFFQMVKAPASRTLKFPTKNAEFFDSGLNRNDGLARHKVIAGCTRSVLVMIPELFSADLFEYQEIFASPIATSVFIYATVAFLLINLGVASLCGRHRERAPQVRFYHRTV